ncbi:thermonuclease family protein [Candidatus Azambacteria bacterium]|nr:thermonuclease family protein [Candidatus Azambacteria bacterium]
MTPVKKTFLGLIVLGFLLILIYTGIPVTPSIQRKNNSSITQLRSQIDKLKTPGNNLKTFLVTRVIDGDTIEIENGSKIRYIGINTPETVDPRKPVECFGEQASLYNQELVLNKQVRLEKDISETDRYGRLLRYVYVGDDFINLKLVQRGFALSSSYPPDLKYQVKFRQAERAARQEKRGLWGECK